MTYTEEEVNEIREKIVSNAKQFLGVPFAHRGRTRFGIDCLGLALLAYKRAGVYLPDGDGRSYEVNWFWFVKEERYMESVNKYFNSVNDPKIGDALMFKLYGKITHGGLYLDNNNFIHSRSGRCVMIESLDHRHWKSRFAGFYRYKDFGDY